MLANRRTTRRLIRVALFAATRGGAATLGCALASALIHLVHHI